MDKGGGKGMKRFVPEGDADRVRSERMIGKWKGSNEKIAAATPHA
jgi:hypothetical protein